jgi:Raf kinase inhibitor-like YbhB/YbcL family protein
MNLRIDGALLKNGLRFRRLSRYTELPSSGVKHVTVKPRGGNAEPIIDRRIYLGGGRFTATTVDGIGDDEGVTTVRFHGAGVAPERGRRATMGALHAVPDADDLAVSLAGQSDATIRRLPPGEFKSKTISGGQHVVELRRRGEAGRGEILASEAIDFDPQSAISVYATGYAEPGDSPGSVGLSLFSVLDDGQRRRNRLLSVTMSAFDYGSAIPTVHTCDGENRSPALSVSGVPNGAESLAILVDDPDAGTQPFTHWTCWNIPPSVDAISGNRPTSETLDAPAGALQGTNDAGEVGYTGPCPPEGDGEHQYRFIVFALDTTLDLEAGAEPGAFESAIEGHVLQSTLSTGTYER